MGGPHVSGPRPIVALDQPLSDGVITLRLLRAEDAPLLHAHISDPEVQAYMSIPLDQTLEGTERFVASRQEEMEQGRGIVFAVTRSTDGELLGSVGIERSIDDPAIGEIGYWLFPSARGNGCMTRAVRLLSAWAFDVLELAREEITVHEPNIASQRVAEKCGFRREGLMRSVASQHGERVDLIMFARLPGDPAPEDLDR
jgi:RimJ/RimL family protein N-acetyltransferase